MPCDNNIVNMIEFTRITVQKSCGSTTNMNNTYFISPRYPITYRGGERCTITVQRCNSNICQVTHVRVNSNKSQPLHLSHLQLRLDFLEATWAQPNSTGFCDLDVFLVSGGSSTVPRICGENTNQHGKMTICENFSCNLRKVKLIRLVSVYVDFNGATPITISVDTNADYAFDRRWNIRIQQIACDSVCRGKFSLFSLYWQNYLPPLF